MPAKRQNQPYVVFLIFPLLSLTLLILSYSVANACLLHYRMIKHGVLTDGTPYFTEYAAPGRSASAYYVRYLFKLNGAEYRGEWYARKDWVKTTKLPATIRIQYLPDAPNINWPPDVAPNRSMPLETFFIFFCLATVFWMVINIIQSLRASRRQRLPSYLTRA